MNLTSSLVYQLCRLGVHVKLLSVNSICEEALRAVFNTKVSIEELHINRFEGNEIFTAEKIGDSKLKRVSITPKVSSSLLEFLFKVIFGFNQFTKISELS